MRTGAAVVAEIAADPADDNGVQDVVNRVPIGPGVAAASWEKLPLAE